MTGYLGEKSVKSLEGTPFEGFGPKEWALEYIGRYGGIDGAHHKTWVLDQVARILLGVSVEVKLAQWANEDGTIKEEEYRFTLVKKETKKYAAWVKELKGDIDPETGETEYDYDAGIAP